MGAHSTDSLCEELATFLSVEVLGGAAAITADTVLAEAGVDSFALMEVILFIERRWGIVLPMERLTPEAVRTVRGLSSSLAEVLDASAA